MQKTAIDIERDFFTMVKDSVLGREIEGSVYRSNMRLSIHNEDCVVRFLAGVDGQIQTGVVCVNVYTDPIEVSGVNIDNKDRCGVLMSLFYYMLEEEESKFSYSLETDGAPRITYDETTNQYVIACRIRYSRLDIEERQRFGILGRSRLGRFLLTNN